MRRAQATQLRDGLKTLRLATIRECYREQADLARKETLTYEGYLLELVNRERETRAHNRVQRLLRESRLPLEKNLDIFDRTRLPALRARPAVIGLDKDGGGVQFAFQSDHITHPRWRRRSSVTPYTTAIGVWSITPQDKMCYAFLTHRTCPIDSPCGREGERM